MIGLILFLSGLLDLLLDDVFAQPTGMPEINSGTSSVSYRKLCSHPVISPIGKMTNGCWMRMLKLSLLVPSSSVLCQGLLPVPMHGCT